MKRSASSSPRTPRNSSLTSITSDDYLNPFRFSVALPGVALVFICGFMLLYLAFSRIPFPLSDVTTDPDNPVSFLHKALLNPTYDYATLKGLQTRLYPGLKPMTIDIGNKQLDKVLASIWTAAKGKQDSWQLIMMDKINYKLQAVATVGVNFREDLGVLMYKDDLVLQLERRSDNLVTVNVRSKSRREHGPNPKSNIEHIEELFSLIRTLFPVVD